jgi:hypothetical protein
MGETVNVAAVVLAVLTVVELADSHADVPELVSTVKDVPPGVVDVTETVTGVDDAIHVLPIFEQ